MMHIFWLSFLYRFSPVLVGTMVLNGLVNKTPGRSMGVPLSVLKSVAKHAHSVVVQSARFESLAMGKSMPGAVEMTARFGGHLDYCAIAVREILSGQIDESTARIRFPEVLKIIEEAQRA